MKLYRLSSRLALLGCSGCIAAQFLTVFWLYECPMFAAQMPGPPRGIVSGKVQSVSNGTLTIISDKPSYSVPQGSKVDFVLTAETMIFNPHARAGASDKQKRHLFPEVTCLTRRFSSYGIPWLGGIWLTWCVCSGGRSGMRGRTFRYRVGSALYGLSTAALRNQNTVIQLTVRTLRRAHPQGS
jgi:hypothetical protein